jgi:Pyruvate/2-oxoacid:ferredoxin oxidoreductase delta subunit
MKDWNEIAKYEKHFREKHGDDFLESPHQNWAPEDERSYREEAAQLREKLKERQKQRAQRKKEGYTVTKKLLNNEISKNCPVCLKYLFEPQDDAYLIKYSCCKTCFVKYVEDREERWESGWRPDLGEETNDNH